MNKSIFPQVFTFILVLGMLIGQQKAFAQYSLAKSEVLATNGVKKIQVTKTAIQRENKFKKEVSKEYLDRTPMKFATYFINPKGLIDSMYNFMGDTINYDIYIYRYKSGNTFSEINRITPSGDVLERQLVARTKENELFYKIWQKEELVRETRATADSIVYRTISRTINSSYYHTRSYDIKNDIQSNTTYTSDSNEVIRNESYQWISKDGIPDCFIYRDYFRGNTNEKSRNKMTTFKVAQDGSVINKLNGLFTDPFHTFNYYERYELFKGIQNPHERLLTQNTLITQKEDSELERFDGTNIVYRYDIIYE